MNKVWFDEAWEDCRCWQTQDRKTLRRINALLRDGVLEILSCRGQYE